MFSGIRFCTQPRHMFEPTRKSKTETDIAGLTPLRKESLPCWHEFVIKSLVPGSSAPGIWLSRSHSLPSSHRHLPSPSAGAGREALAAGVEAEWVEWAEPAWPEAVALAVPAAWDCQASVSATAHSPRAEMARMARASFQFP